MKIRVEISSLAETSPSGVGHYTRQLYEALDSHTDTSLTGSYYNFLNRKPTPVVKDHSGLDVSSLIPLKVYAKLQSLNLAWPFDILKKSVDLTIFPNFATWPTIRSKLKATVVHDLTYLYMPEVVESKNLSHLRRVVPRSIQEADFIITVSETVKSEITKEFNLNPERCIVTPIPPGEEFRKTARNEVHKKYGIPTKKYIYFIGNMEPRKDLPTLIAAYRMLPRVMKDEYSLVLAGGKGWENNDSLNALNEAQAAGENIVHIGYIEQADSPSLYQKASLFVMPSVYEGFGMPVLEAMASRTPVIASDIPVLKETGGSAAIYAKSKNPNDFAEKIKLVLSNSRLMDELNKKAQTRVNDVSWKQNAESIINFAQSILEK